MSECTRLDEIVEEVLRDYPAMAGYTARDWARAIAERAFRHGVERLDEERGLGHVTRVWKSLADIQPAPAEPPPWPTKDGRHAPWCIDNEHLFGPCVCGRRGSERRKGPNRSRDVGFGYRVYDTGAYPGEAGWSHSWNDRRSGKDRRGAWARVWWDWQKDHFPPPLPRFEHTGRFVWYRR